MKIGDKYLCKKSLKNENFIFKESKYNFIFKENKYYEIIKVQTLYVTLICEEFENFINHFNLSTSTFSSVSPLIFSDFFYTKKEERQLKLKRLDAKK